jgi:glycosyltransferase involved in cell wall biosynthesis
MALTAGVDRARGRLVAVMDADLQDPPELLAQMLAKTDEGYEVVYAQRTAREGESAFKRATAHLFYRLMRRWTNVDIPVDTGDFRLMGPSGGFRSLASGTASSADDGLGRLPPDRVPYAALPDAGETSGRSGRCSASRSTP